MGIKIHQKSEETFIVGQLRIIEKFILFPCTIKNIKVWCQYACIQQKYWHSWSLDDGDQYFWTDHRFVLPEELISEKIKMQSYNYYLELYSKQKGFDGKQFFVDHHQIKEL